MPVTQIMPPPAPISNAAPASFSHVEPVHRSISLAPFTTHAFPEPSTAILTALPGIVVHDEPFHRWIVCEALVDQMVPFAPMAMSRPLPGTVFGTPPSPVTTFKVIWSIGSQLGQKWVGSLVSPMIQSITPALKTMFFPPDDCVGRKYPRSAARAPWYVTVARESQLPGLVVTK